MLGVEIFAVDCSSVRFGPSLAFRCLSEGVVFPGRLVFCGALLFAEVPVLPFGEIRSLLLSRGGFVELSFRTNLAPAEVGIIHF